MSSTTAAYAAARARWIDTDSADDYSAMITMADAMMAEVDAYEAQRQVAHAAGHEAALAAQRERTGT